MNAVNKKISYLLFFAVFLCCKETFSLVNYSIPNNSFVVSKVTTQDKKTATLLDKEETRNAITIICLSAFSILIMALLVINKKDSLEKVKKLNKKLKKQNKQLKENDKERLQFFSVISHEFKTPIYGLYNTLELIKNSDNTFEKQNYFEILEHTSNYLFQLSKNVLHYSRFNLEKIKVHNANINVEDVLIKLMNSLKYSAKVNKNKLSVTVDKSIKNVLIDESILSQIITNLLSNAIKYSDGGKIDIKAKNVLDTPTHQQIEFSVADEGFGVDENKKETIFNPYKRLDPNSGKGTGLGLYIVKKLVDTLGGNIKIETEKNKGSVFSFVLTLEKSTAINTIKEEFTKNIKKDTKILIVDDNKVNLLVTKKSLEAKGFICETAINGFIAIKRIKEVSFDMVLIDINMPKIDGYQTSKKIKEIDPKIPILAITALDYNEVFSKADAIGINGILNKPFNNKDLITRIYDYI